MPITGALTEGGAPLGTDPGEMHSPDWTPPTAQPVAQTRPAQRQPFPTPNPQAVPVFERSASDWGPFNYSGGRLGTVPIQIVRHLKGRKAATIAVLTTESNGVAIDPDPGPLSEYIQSGVAGLGVYIMNPGDSVTIESEASIWASCQTGQTAGGCQGWETFNPAVLDPGQEF